jgi:hypothetical protein
LTITAKNASKAYGTTLTFLGTEFTTAGLLNADTVTSVTLTSAGAAATAAVGPYPIVPSAAVGTGLANYTITYANGTLTVNPVPLTITANSAGKIYGQTLTFAGTEFTATGLLNGNTVTSVTLTSAGAAAAAAVPGPYPIVPSAAVGTGLTNYAIAYVNGALTVSQATTLTTITSNLPNPSLRGQIVTFGVSVAPQFTGAPSGSVTVTANTGETCTATLTLGAGSCNLTFLTGGNRTVTAVYGGDTNFLASPTSAPVVQVISSVDLSTRSLLFGPTLLNTPSASQAVTLTNVGTAALAISSIATSGNFSQTNTCPANLAAAQSCRINVRFTPTSLGVLTGTLTIIDADPTSPQLVSLSGTGVDPAAVLSPTSLNFGTILRGTAKTLPITLSNATGTAALTINGISFGGANPRQFTQTNNCGGSLAIGATCTINVTFSTGRGGRPATYNATLNVSDSAPGSPQIATLTGTTQ